MRTFKQELATKRNYNKFSIVGMIGRLKDEGLTPEEKMTKDNILGLMISLLDNWDENTVKLGLTVRPKKDKFI